MVFACIRRLMQIADAIMDEIAELLKREKKPNGATKEEITAACEKYKRLLILLDGAFSGLRTVDPTREQCNLTEEFIQKPMEAWREMGFSVTPKAHVFETHAIKQMRTYVGGLGEKLEDWLEHHHQIGHRLEQRFRGMKDRRARCHARRRAEHMISNPGMQVAREKVNPKRGRSQGEIEAQQQRVAKRMAVLREQQAN